MGEAGGQWILRRETGQWNLYALEPGDSPPANRVMLDQETTWRLFTQGIDRQTALANAEITGDRALGMVFFNTVSMLI